MSYMQLKYTILLFTYINFICNDILGYMPIELDFICQNTLANWILQPLFDLNHISIYKHT